MDLRILTGSIVAAAMLNVTANAGEPPSNGTMRCESIGKGMSLAPVEGAAVVVKNATTVAAGDGLPAHCEVNATISPQTGVLIRMPITDWNGRLLFAGCGGLCGSFRQMDDNKDALIRGYAVATTDMGRQDPTGSDRSWWNDQAKLDEFGWISTHRATLVAKQALVAFYGEKQKYAYIRGCSTGGRQALTEALRYPDDFEGVIAGAPATDGGTPTNAFAYFSNLDAAEKPILDASAVKLLADETLKACDKNDGLADRLVSNPMACKFDAAKLTCRPGQTDQCLTPTQVAVAKKITAGPKGPDGKLWGPFGYAPGSEKMWAASVAGVDGKPPARANSAPGYLAGMVGEGAKPADFDFAKHGIGGGPMKLRLELGPDGKALKPFLARKGKILMWHGWADIEATPATSLRFYAGIHKGLGAKALADSFRLFMVPGVGHCRGGYGPDVIDTLSAMEAWVERGETPDQLIAYKLKQGQRRPDRFPLAHDSFDFSRPLYPYPAYSHFSGQGDANAAVSFIRK